MKSNSNWLLLLLCNILGSELRFNSEVSSNCEDLFFFLLCCVVTCLMNPCFDLPLEKSFSLQDLLNLPREKFFIARSVESYICLSFFSFGV